MTKPKLWTCGDCGCQYRLKVTKCQHYFDDYLGVRGITTLDDAMLLAISPVLIKFDKAIMRMENPAFAKYWYPAEPFYHKAVTILPYNTTP